MPQRHPERRLDLLLPAERALVERIHAPPVYPEDRDFLELAALRLRNIIEKYAEEYKRAALKDKDAQGASELEACARLETCRAALEACRAKLSSGFDAGQGT